MRSCEGKNKALWLDHAGNIERFAIDMFDVWNNGVGELSKASTKDKTPRERNATTREKLVCPECRGALRANTCLCCGWERPARSQVKALDGELHAFNLSQPQENLLRPRDGLRAECLKQPSLIWAAALYFTSLYSKGGSEHSRKWAYGIWRGIYPFNKLPSGWYTMAQPKTCSREALALVERETKRFRKKRVAA